MQDYLPYITGSGGALVVLAIVAYLFLTGKLHSDSEFRREVAEKEAYKEALETERAISTEVARAGGVNNQLIGALVQVVTDRNAGTQAGLRAAIPDSGLTARDLGLAP